jgi:hypothetical protein
MIVFAIVYCTAFVVILFFISYFEKQGCGKQNKTDVWKT